MAEKAFQKPKPYYSCKSMAKSKTRLFKLKTN